MGDEVDAASAALAALSGVRQALEADGYELRLSAGQPGHVTVSIEATSDACPECLVPEPVLRSIVEAQMESTGLDLIVHVEHPARPSGP